MEEISVTLIIQQSDINHVIKEPLQLTLSSGESVLDVIRRADEELLERVGKFPVKGYKSLLHMVYHPFEHRFYKQVAIQSYTQPGSFLNVRENPQKPLPNGITIIIVPEGPCISEVEAVVDW